MDNSHFEWNNLVSSGFGQWCKCIPPQPFLISTIEQSRGDPARFLIPGEEGGRDGADDGARDAREAHAARAAAAGRPTGRSAITRAGLTAPCARSACCARGASTSRSTAASRGITWPTWRPYTRWGGSWARPCLRRAFHRLGHGVRLASGAGEADDSARQPDSALRVHGIPGTGHSVFRALGHGQVDAGRAVGEVSREPHRQRRSCAAAQSRRGLDGLRLAGLRFLGDLRGGRGAHRRDRHAQAGGRRTGQSGSRPRAPSRCSMRR